MFSHVSRFKVRFGETDAAGIVYYPNYYKWMDQATHDLMFAAGFSTRRLMEEELGVPLIEAQCRFQGPLRFEDEVKLVSAVTEVRNKVFRLSHQFYHGDRLVAEGYEVRAWVSFRGGTLKAQALPEALRDQLLSSPTV